MRLNDSNLSLQIIYTINENKNMTRSHSNSLLFIDLTCYGIRINIDLWNTSLEREIISMIDFLLRKKSDEPDRWVHQHNIQYVHWDSSISALILVDSLHIFFSTIDIDRYSSKSSSSIPFDVQSNIDDKSFDYNAYNIPYNLSRNLHQSSENRSNTKNS